MKTVRIWFRKVGTARYISHLDLNRCMARAIHKAKIPLWYTEGFNPHAFLTFALPLSLGISGERESMDIKLEDTDLSDEELIQALNSGLPEDIHAFSLTTPVMKPGQIVSASYEILLDTEGQDATPFAQQISKLFQTEMLSVPKHTKSGWIEFNIAPYLGQTKVAASEKGVQIQAVLPAGSNLNINPMLLIDAIKKYLNIDFYPEVRRTELYGENSKIFE